MDLPQDHKALFVAGDGAYSFVLRQVFGARKLAADCETDERLKHSLYIVCAFDHSAVAERATTYGKGINFAKNTCVLESMDSSLESICKGIAQGGQCEEDLFWAIMGDDMRGLAHDMQRLFYQPNRDGSWFYSFRPVNGAEKKASILKKVNQLREIAKEIQSRVGLEFEKQMVEGITGFLDSLEVWFAACDPSRQADSIGTAFFDTLKVEDAKSMSTQLSKIQDGAQVELNYFKNTIYQLKLTLDKNYE